MRNNKLPYVEYLPDNFLTIILDERAIQQNLFNKDNKYYDYLLKNEQEYLSFYMIPNLDINDRFLINAKIISGISGKKSHLKVTFPWNKLLSRPGKVI